MLAHACYKAFPLQRSRTETVMQLLMGGICRFKCSRKGTFPCRISCVHACYAHHMHSAHVIVKIYIVFCLHPLPQLVKNAADSVEPLAPVCYGPLSCPYKCQTTVSSEKFMVARLGPLFQVTCGEQEDNTVAQHVSAAVLRQYSVAFQHLCRLQCQI